MWFVGTLILLNCWLNVVLSATQCDFPQSLCFDSQSAFENLDNLETAIDALPSTPNSTVELENLITQIKDTLQLPNSPNTYRSCADVPRNSTSGLYLMAGEFRPPYYAYCDMDYSGGGWQVFQRRFNGQTNFQRDWASYKNGFGELSSGEFWWGLDNLYRVTNLAPHELVVVLEDFDGITAFARYNRFQISDESDLYRLNILGTYSGTAGDAMRRCLNMAFTTSDRDNDIFATNCAVLYTGAWWYSNCHDSNLNGQYLSGNTSLFAKGVTWTQFRTQNYSLKRTLMMIRRLP
ncbi:ficolin-2-like [Anopheles albimanus]|uniref:Fibrinogen C-terminal domain-containing protein n=1 Tax=Anopheles albimanus TaxID=7167 RepID=A0A182FLD8_ANOAL|nr:ficolin-2-like [Anopheles albimanus]